MLNAKDAAAKTALAKQSMAFEHELRTIEQRITGATAAGSNNVEVIFEGNVFDEDTINKLSQILIEEGYQVRFKQRTKLGHPIGWQFNISW